MRFYVIAEVNERLAAELYDLVNSRLGTGKNPDDRGCVELLAVDRLTPEEAKALDDFWYKSQAKAVGAASPWEGEINSWVNLNVPQPDWFAADPARRARMEAARSKNAADAEIVRAAGGGE